jgi:hypothetical protein
MVKAGHGLAGRLIDTFLDGVETSAEYAAVGSSDGGYTTNLPLVDITGGKAWSLNTGASRCTRARRTGALSRTLPKSAGTAAAAGI